MSTLPNTDQREFLELMEGVRKREPQAARTLVEQYTPHVTRSVRRYRARELRSKFDLEDYVQDVWKAFFRRAHVLHFEQPRVLLGFLFRLAHNEVITRTLHFLRTQKSDVRREISLDDPSLDGTDLPSAEAPPWNRLECRDEIDGILRRFPHRLGSEIVRRIGEGHSQKDAARQLNVSEKTVSRVMTFLRDWAVDLEACRVARSKAEPGNP
jgi:RNA polymerase sigma factor (sigma-70 family)